LGRFLHFFGGFLLKFALFPALFCTLFSAFRRGFRLKNITCTNIYKNIYMSGVPFWLSTLVLTSVCSSFSPSFWSSISTWETYQTQNLRIPKHTTSNIYQNISKTYQNISNHIKSYQNQKHIKNKSKTCQKHIKNISNHIKNKSHYLFRIRLLLSFFTLLCLFRRFLGCWFSFLLKTYIKTYIYI